MTDQMTHEELRGHLGRLERMHVHRERIREELRQAASILRGVEISVNQGGETIIGREPAQALAQVATRIAMTIAAHDEAMATEGRRA